MPRATPLAKQHPLSFVSSTRLVCLSPSGDSLVPFVVRSAVAASFFSRAPRRSTMQAARRAAISLARNHTRPMALSATTPLAPSLVARSRPGPLLSLALSGLPSRRWNSTWIAPARDSPFECTVPPSYAGLTTAGAETPAPILIYETGHLMYMKGLGWALLFVVLPFSAYLSWPTVRRAFEQEQEGGDSQTGDAAIGEDSSAPVASSIATPSSASSSSSATATFRPTPLAPTHQSVANYLLGMNVLILVAIGALARFNSTLIHKIYLYPQSRLLSLHTLGALGLGRSPAQLVRLDAVLPPLARVGNEGAMKFKLEVDRHPIVTPEDVTDGEPRALDARPLAPPSEFTLFPVPNRALYARGYLSQEKVSLDQFWLRFLSTGVHTTDQLEEIQAIQVEKPRRH